MKIFPTHLHVKPQFLSTLKNYHASQFQFISSLQELPQDFFITPPRQKHELLVKMAIKIHSISLM